MDTPFFVHLSRFLGNFQLPERANRPLGWPLLNNDAEFTQLVPYGMVSRPNAQVGQAVLDADNVQTMLNQFRKAQT